MRENVEQIFWAVCIHISECVIRNLGRFFSQPFLFEIIHENQVAKMRKLRLYNVDFAWRL